MRLVRRGRDERVARSGAGSGPEPVEEPSAQHALPGGRSSHQRLGDRRHDVAGERDRLALAQAVRQPAGKALHDVLRRLGDAVDEADGASARVQCLRQKDRQDRVEHLRRNVGEQAGAGEQERIAREAGKVPLSLRLSH